jgi:hypothetical protein
MLALAALLPAACSALAPPTPSSPFIGSWTNPDRQLVGFRDDAIVLTPPNEPPTPMSLQTCDGTYRFAYGEKGRDALLALTPRQPDLRRELTGLLVQPTYPVAEVNCGEGYSAYVLLNDHDMVVIHRDRDIAGLERLSR